MLATAGGDPLAVGAPGNGGLNTPGGLKHMFYYALLAFYSFWHKRAKGRNLALPKVGF